MQGVALACCYLNSLNVAISIPLNEDTKINPQKLNRIVSSIFGPVLILTGIAGFLTPPQASLTSGAAPYNIFHIIFGVIGLLMVIAKKPEYFNFGFGLIDIYQAIASYLSLPPKQFFLWTSVDDILHVVLGVGLALIGLYGILKQKEELR